MSSLENVTDFWVYLTEDKEVSYSRNVDDGGGNQFFNSKRSLNLWL